MHFVGIKGVGVSAVARILKASGVEVTGSDVDRVFPTDAGLAAAGIVPNRGFDRRNIASPDIVVHSPAWTETNPEIAEARARGLRVMSYPEFLGLLMTAKRGISIAGTHGKTTTTAMTALILYEAGLDPQAVIGVGEAYIGEGEFLVVESCEYRRHFLNYHPEIAVITSVELDHPDYFKSLDDYVSAFQEFAMLLPDNGFLVVRGDDSLARGLKSPARKLTYGLGAENDLYLVPEPSGGQNRYRVLARAERGRFDSVRRQEIDLGQFFLPIPGRHNALNSVAAIAVAREVGVDIEVARRALAHFRGVHRRLEYLGDWNGVPVYDDYAHHPTAISVTIDAVRETMPGRRVWVVFQPHTYSRTEALLEEFAEALGRADRLVLAETFASAREPLRTSGEPSLTAAKVSESASRNGRTCEALFLPTSESIVDYLRSSLRQGDVLVTMGAGDVYQVGYELVGRHE